MSETIKEVTLYSLNTSFLSNNVIVTFGRKKHGRQREEKRTHNTTLPAMNEGLVHCSQ